MHQGAPHQRTHMLQIKSASTQVLVTTGVAVNTAAIHTANIVLDSITDQRIQDITKAEKRIHKKITYDYCVHVFCVF